MAKITMLGAGSAFTEHLMRDIMLIDGIERGTINLVDLDARRLDISSRWVRELAERIDRGWTINASTDRRKVLKGSDYIINCIEVSGTATVAVDYRVPKKYGIDQCIGDTIGPGGIFKALRTVPAWLDILRDVEKLCPNAMILNYTNPMSMMTLAAVRASTAPVVGLCHSVQGTGKKLARFAEVPYEEMQFNCSGINHMAWFTKLTHKGTDLYPKIFKRAREEKEVYEADPVRFDMMFHFGAFVTESSGHFSEYVPYYRKRPDLIKRYMRERYLGASGFYSKSWPKWRRDADSQRLKDLKKSSEMPLTRSHEYAASIIEAHQMHRSAEIYGSVKNEGLIPNLPADGVVEVPVLITGNGIFHCRVEKLPAQLAALCSSNMAVFNCAVEGILKRDKDAVYHAMLLDPLSAAVCSPAEIVKMTDEMARLESDYIPKFMNK